ncbi:MAG: MoaD/ThiS family protein [Gammaproteobacteria bacterium]|nr:MoaD/ThiS family protein [Gammaproteobacteria bacterium]MDE0611180.1 MoaD/ThiS family protein [Gammaproteobacteria bacterium]
MSITVRFFASLRDRIGRESVEIEANGLNCVQDVWKALVKQEPDARVLVAINARHAALDAKIQDGDEIAFFPPVTGG